MPDLANIVFIGPMGAGKTSLGRRVAERLGLVFVDADQVIEQRTGASIPVIFECEGEAGFRAREKAVIAELCGRSGQLLATGGGAVLDVDNRAALKAAGLVVYLQTSVAQQLARVQRDRNRPLLQTADPAARLHDLAQQRNAMYRELADLTFDSDGMNADTAGERLGNLLAAHWPAPARDTGTLKMSATRMVSVALGARTYSIHIGAGLLSTPSLWRPLLRGRQVLVVSDEHVAPHYLARVRAGLGDCRHECLILPPGEQEKTLHRFAEVMQALAAIGANRDATIIALGGGVIGDLAGFAAACWMRGIRFVQMPTTLLAMVDSSVGGKTAVDLPQGKNLVGAFHQPAGVIADIDTLATLPAREVRAGLAEVVKYGALGDPDFFAWLEAHADALLACDPPTVTEAIARSCAHKAAIVARDETEQGERALLNLGHTFGHAIETEQGYGGLLHGEAVAVGMVLAARLSAQLGLAPTAAGERLSQLLRRLQLPIAIPPGLDPQRLLVRMRLDKKSVSGAIKLILWRGIGNAFVASDIAEAAILDVMAHG